MRRPNKIPAIAKEKLESSVFEWIAALSSSTYLHSCWASAKILVTVATTVEEVVCHGFLFGRRAWHLWIGRKSIQLASFNAKVLFLSHTPRCASSPTVSQLHGHNNTKLSHRRTHTFRQRTESEKPMWQWDLLRLNYLKGWEQCWMRKRSENEKLKRQGRWKMKEGGKKKEEAIVQTCSFISAGKIKDTKKRNKN